MRALLACLALGTVACSIPGSGSSAQLKLDPTAAYAPELELAIARALVGQGWVPVSVDSRSLVTEWRDIDILDDDAFPSRYVVRILATFDRDQLTLRLESRTLDASCAGVPHPPADLTLVGCAPPTPSLFWSASLEAFAEELAFALDTRVIVDRSGS
jgi:hypothetical protein